MLSEEDIERFRASAPKPKPEPKLVVEPGNPQTIANAKARPDKVKIVTESNEGVVVIDRTQHGRVEVLEVDRDGRPSLVRIYDGSIEYQNGYPKVGAVSVYNPLDALKGDQQ